MKKGQKGKKFEIDKTTILKFEKMKMFSGTCQNLVFLKENW